MTFEEKEEHRIKWHDYELILIGETFGHWKKKIKKELLEETVQHLKDCLGASDPTCYSPDYYEGFNEAIRLLEDKK